MTLRRLKNDRSPRVCRVNRGSVAAVRTAQALEQLGRSFSTVGLAAWTARLARESRGYSAFTRGAL